MQVIETVGALRAQVKAWRREGMTIGFVPTMGNLHQGHLSLVNKAKELSDKVIVSIFVNPLQFDDKDDLAAYPRTVADDIQQLTSVECDTVFTPTVEIMYPQGMATHTNIIVPEMDDKLCGLKRPGHFDGVATVVTKLLNMVQTDVAVFGEKDYQQLLLIRKLVADLNIPVDVVAAPTHREASGLAMSSRNQYLTPQQKELAAELYRVLQSVHDALIAAKYTIADIQNRAVSELEQLGFEPDYLDIRRSEDLAMATPADTKLRILVAARLGKARLIDNIACNLA